MPKPIRKPPYDRKRLMLDLSLLYDELCEKHHREQKAIGNRIPVGGGDWMDLFFRMEAIRGALTSLRLGNTLEQAIKDGKAVSEISVSVWNKRREWQVHRWPETAHSFLERTIQRLKNAQTNPQVE